MPCSLALTGVDKYIFFSLPPPRERCPARSTNSIVRGTQANPCCPARSHLAGHGQAEILPGQSQAGTHPTLAAGPGSTRQGLKFPQPPPEAAARSTRTTASGRVAPRSRSTRAAALPRGTCGRGYRGRSTQPAAGEGRSSPQTRRCHWGPRQYGSPTVAVN